MAGAQAWGPACQGAGLSQERELLKAQEAQRLGTEVAELMSRLDHKRSQLARALGAAPS